MSDSVLPHKRQPTRLPRPWDSPGKNTGVGCHFLLQCMKVKSESEITQSCLTLSDPMDYSPPGPPFMGFSRQEHWSGLPLPYIVSAQSMSCEILSFHESREITKNEASDKSKDKQMLLLLLLLSHFSRVQLCATP